MSIIDTNPLRIKIALNASTEQKDGDNKIRNQLSTEIVTESGKTGISDSANSSNTAKSESAIQRSNGWAATKGPINRNTNSISERSVLESRLNIERQQRLSTISANVAQLLGRLNQESLSVGCGLWISQSSNKGYLKCSPENLTGQIQFYLSPTNIEWVNRIDLETPTMCIPIQIRDAQAGC